MLSPIRNPFIIMLPSLFKIEMINLRTFNIHSYDTIAHTTVVGIFLYILASTLLCLGFVNLYLSYLVPRQNVLWNKKAILCWYKLCCRIRQGFWSDCWYCSDVNSSWNYCYLSNCVCPCIASVQNENYIVSFLLWQKYSL